MSRLYNLKEGSAKPDQIKNLLADTLGIPDIGNIYYVDTVNGNNNNTGTRRDDAFASVATAHGACTANQNDVVIFLARATSDQPSAAITWSKDYTHLIGTSADLPGMGQRCRIVNTSTNDLATLFTVSADGSRFYNLQFFDGKDKAEDGACVLVSGDRNIFVNCFFAGMGDGTAGAPATRAGSESLNVTGDENHFRDCEIGLDTIARTAANAELRVSGVRNSFLRCKFRSNSTTAGKFLVQIDNSTQDMRDTWFTDCKFFNYTSNWATGITNAFDMPAGGNTHYVVLERCTLVGVGTGWADTVTHVYSADAAPNAGFGIATNPTT